MQVLSEPGRIAGLIDQLVRQVGARERSIEGDQLVKVARSQIVVAEIGDQRDISQTVATGIKPRQQASHAVANQIGLGRGHSGRAESLKNMGDPDRGLIEIIHEGVGASIEIILRVNVKPLVVLDRPIPGGATGPDSMQQDNRRARERKKNFLRLRGAVHFGGHGNASGA